MTDPRIIAAAVAAHPDVLQAEAIPVLVDGTARTLAVVTANGFVTAAVLRGSLGRELGGAHTGVGLLVLDVIPQRDGAIDAEAVDSLMREAGDAVWFQPPADEVEAELAAIWAEALGLAEISVLDAFLDLGGDSLAAIRITAAVEQRFDVVFDLDDLLDATIRGLARTVRARRSGRARESV